MTDNLVRIATYWSSFDAETAKLHLDRCGIPSIVSSLLENVAIGRPFGSQASRGNPSLGLAPQAIACHASSVPNPKSTKQAIGVRGILIQHPKKRQSLPGTVCDLSNR